MSELDLTDKKILAELQAHGRISNTDLSRKVGLSESPCLRRVRNLEDDRVIAGYSALLDHRKLGLEIVAYVQVNLDQRSEADTNAFVKALIPCVLMSSGELPCDGSPRNNAEQLHRRRSRVRRDRHN